MLCYKYIVMWMAYFPYGLMFIRYLFVMSEEIGEKR